MASLLFRFSSSLIQLNNYRDIRLRTKDDPTLRTPARELRKDEINSEHFKALVNRMVGIMREHRGQGMAAPQVGCDLQILVVEFSPEDFENSVKYYGAREVQKRRMDVFPLMILVNPKLRVKNFETTVFEEGCLSMRGTTGMVKRFKEVEIECLNERGESVKFSASGWMARILQHEVHHLKGLLISDYFVKKTNRWLR